MDNLVFSGTSTSSTKGDLVSQLKGKFNELAGGLVDVANKNLKNVKLPTVKTDSQLGINPVTVVLIVAAFLLIKGK